jgi:hypothetical protein
MGFIHINNLPIEIKLLDAVKNPYPYYSAADIVVLPSRVGGDHNTQAQTDLESALSNASARVSDLTIPDALDGQTLTRGVYDGGALSLSAGKTLTLNGSATDVFIIRASSTLNINGGIVLLTGGAVWSNVFWDLGTSATIIGGSTFNGIILAKTTITLDIGATLVTGQLLANTAAVTIGSDLLPVELTTFTAAFKNNAVNLNWNTATEVNNYGFDVQRSPSSGALNDTQNYSWTNAGFVYGSGNSNSPKNYSFIESTVSYGSYAYRLKQIDDNGTFAYSGVIEVNTRQITYSFLLNQNYPNPFNPSTQIQFEVSKNTYAALTIFNVLGENVLTLFNGNVIAGQVYNVIFNGDKLASGIYFYQLKTSEKTEAKKMILMR